MLVYFLPRVQSLQFLYAQLATPPAHLRIHLVASRPLNDPAFFFANKYWSPVFLDTYFLEIT